MGTVVGLADRITRADTMRIVWTEPALRDLLAVRTYIAADKPSAATKQVELPLKAADGLAKFPNIGQPGRRAATRELVVGQTPYILPYRVREDQIEILRVLHGRQRWPDRFA